MQYLIVFCLFTADLLATVKKVEPLEVYEPGGEIEFRDSAKNFGKVQRGVKISYRFNFTNTGQGPFRIDGYHSDCGCTVVDHNSDKIYQPGDQGYVVVELDTEQFVGKIVKPIVILTDNPLMSQHTLVMEAEVVNSVSVIPPVIDTGSLVRGKAFTTPVIVKPIGDYSEFRIRGVKSSSEFVAADYEEQEDESWKLVLHINPSLPKGPISEEIWVETNSPFLPSIRIPIRGSVASQFWVPSDQVEFGSIRPGQTVLRTLKLKGIQNQEMVSAKTLIFLNGKEIESDTGLFRHELKIKEKYSQLTLYLTHASTEKKGAISGNVSLKFADSDTDPIDLKFFAHLQ